MGSLAAGSRQFEASHQLLSSYTERTDRGGEVAQATIKGALMTIAVASTGAWAAGAFAVSSGGIGALAASSAATATVAGVTAGGFTAIEQLNAGQFDPGAIGQAALAEAARTFVTGLAGGVLERAFSAALSSAVTRVAGQVPAEAARILQGEGASQVIAFLAGTSSGALVSSVETVLRERAAGRPMSTDEFCRLLVTEMIKGGLYQLAVNAVVRRAKRGFVDRRGQTQEETVAAGSAKDKYILQTIEDKKQAYELLIPEQRDHNNAIYHKQAGMPVLPGARGMASTSSKDAFLHESLYVSAHGSPFGVSGGNREVANMAAKAVLQLAKDGHPVARVVLDACSQRDKRFAFFGKSNAQAFEAGGETRADQLEHQVQVGGQRIHRHHFLRQRADHPRQRIAHQFVIGHPLRLAGEMALDGFRRPLVQHLLDVGARALWLQAQRIADEIGLRAACVQRQVELLAEMAQRIDRVAGVRVRVGENLGHANLVAGRPSHSSAVPW